MNAEGIQVRKERFSISNDKVIYEMMKQTASEECRTVSNLYEVAAKEYLIRKGKIAVEDSKS